ncbi:MULTISPECIES: M56 family metallopeptidase [Chitinophagaceae]
MNSLFLYIIKVLVCSGILFLYYWTVLRNKKFHQYNRFYLLFSVGFSLLVPFVHLSWFTFREDTVNQYSLVRVLYEGNLNPIVVTNRVVGWDTITMYSMVGVSAILFLLLTIRVLSVFRLAKKFPVVKLEGVDFLDTDIPSAPFSFLNYLFWKQNIDVQSKVGKQILEHELTHIHQKHTWDKLFMQMVSAVLWFNPFYWLMQRELLMIHEFLADEKAVGNQDVQSFARMLLEAHYGKKILEPIHPFAYRPIHRRLKMLTNSSNPKYSYMRRLFFLPLLLIVTGLFAFTVKKQEWTIPHIDMQKWAKAAGINLSSYDKITIKQQSAPLPDSIIVIHDNKKRDTIPNISSLKLNFVKDNSVHGLQDSERTLQLQGKVSGVKIETEAPSPEVKPVSVSPLGSDPSRQPLYVLDGVPMDENTEPLKTIHPNDIESISVLKDNASSAIYGPRGQNGVILITTKVGHKGTTNDKDSTKKVVIVHGYRKDNSNANENKGIDNNEVVVVGYGKKQKEDKQDVDKEPLFPGGANAWRIFLMRNLKADVPTNHGAPANHNYTVLVSFLVNKNGKLSQIKAITNPGYGTAEEVIRLMKESPNWEPAIKNGKPVLYRQKQQVTFQITDK